MEAIVPVVEQSLKEANIGFADVDAIAATQGPGLVGSLLVGFSFAKAAAYSLQIPWIGVDHLEGHINSVFLEPTPPAFPFVVLLVSGGHTSVYHVKSHVEYELMGRTRDDAAGEAYDKVAKMLGLGYPGGGVIDRLATEGDPKKIRFPRAYLDKTKFDFSFSGLKTAVNRYIQTHPDTCREDIPDIAAGFQEAVVEVLSYKLVHAAMSKDCTAIAIVGGVAANERLREKICRDAQKMNLQAYLPSKALCGDNAAMIGSVAFHRLSRGETAALDADVYSRLRLS
jgi:N6-L-threonylcarbamoyladenine synthase